jgi:hypothetical protein
MSLKKPVTTPEIDPGTVRLVAQRLNHYATPGPTSIAINTSEMTAHILFSVVVDATEIVSD